MDYGAAYGARPDGNKVRLKGPWFPKKRGIPKVNRPKMERERGVNKR